MIDVGRFVSDHAVVRWLERAKGVDLDKSWLAGASQARLAAYGCRQIGMTIDEAKDEICPPRLYRLVAMGPQAIVAGNLRFPIAHGVIKTCLTKGMWR